MITVRIALAVILICTFARAQDTIQGMYSYTYGDNESLVEARQTCKDLALRDAIESYYLFIESSTTIENAQVKEDLIHSIAAGNLSDVQVVEQTEEGRTITMTVTAVVNGEEIQALVASQAEKPQSDVQSEGAQPQDDAAFFHAMDQFENQMQTDFGRSDRQDVHSALDRQQRLMAELDRRKPPSKNPFQWIVYQCIRQRLQAQGAMGKLRYFRSKKNAVQAKNQEKTLQDLSRILLIKTDALQSFQHLSESNQKIQTVWVRRCRETLIQSKKLLAPLSRR